MRISRVFYPDISKQSHMITLSAEISHYLIRVLRHKNSHQVILFNDSDGCEYLGEIIDADPKKAILQVLSTTEKHNESPIYIHLFQALSKGDKLETVIQKATELGTNELTPMLTERVDYKLNQDRIAHKLEHWQKIAISASEQSARVFIPKINTPRTLADALTIDADIKLFLSPHSSKSIGSLHQYSSSAKRFAIFIGPEGGFSDDEKQLALSKNCHSIQLGKRILRTETAPLAIISILQALWGDY
ncbi:16S rRNA (uracil(1498)-N(3))-methyltransferase [Cysteiniphilum halobium]|uniref:16S rRNA (uracil(1498)-N(3))-methyltransferase n=1 Tax=Cysteiniphilum halobium TaxID=2219059 RepID=UPI000E64E71C|nr:16S rRNA (uracil(1498)-N(3))-methyltransferase [Cysteiniphilum halobium]